LFAHALRLHGKDFHTIQREFFGGRSASASNTASAGSANGTGASANSLTTGRTRGRGGGRRKVTVAPPKSTSREDEDVKPEDGKDDTTASVEDASRNVAQADPAIANTSSEPVKTVKELIAFYYYWKRKGAAASSSCASSGGCGTGVGSGLASSGSAASSLGQINGALASAAVNFSAAVAAAANADNALSAAHAASGATGSQSYGASGKKRKQTARGNLLTRQAVLGLIESRKSAEGALHKRLALKNLNGRAVVLSPATIAARASTPTSELSESVGASLPESEVEDTAESAAASCNTEETQQPIDSHPERDEDTTGTTRPGTESSEVPPSGRLRRRLCRNCDKDLSSPGESALPAGEDTIRGTPLSHLPPRPGSTPACKSRPTVEACPRSIKSGIGSTPRDSVQPVVTLTTTPVPTKPVTTHARKNDCAQSISTCDMSEGSEEEDHDLMALICAPPREPVPCFAEVHQSLWSSLARTWDRSIQIPIHDSTHQRVLNDLGTCARTDLIYVGRRLAIEDKARWLWEREQLYAKYADTAIGPGAVDLSASNDRPMPLSANTTRSVANQAQRNEVSAFLFSIYPPSLSFNFRKVCEMVSLVHGKNAVHSLRVESLYSPLLQISLTLYSN
uniref:AF4/FMR2 family member lilli n=1 Tax=Echinostoma caproni TaxID=27848 RepID=A0A183AFU6_9TREM